jgi:hypothetical protein
LTDCVSNLGHVPPPMRPAGRRRLQVPASRSSARRFRGSERTIPGRAHHALLADEHGVSASRLYWENKLGLFDFKDVTVPAAVTVFPNELDQAPRGWAEQAFPNLIYYHQVDKGNHVAAWQEPELSSPRCVRVPVTALIAAPPHRRSS